MPPKKEPKKEKGCPPVKKPGPGEQQVCGYVRKKPKVKQNPPKKTNS